MTAPLLGTTRCTFELVIIIVLYYIILYYIILYYIILYYIILYYYCIVIIIYCYY